MIQLLRVDALAFVLEAAVQALRADRSLLIAFPLSSDDVPTGDLGGTPELGTPELGTPELGGRWNSGEESSESR